MNRPAFFICILTIFLFFTGTISAAETGQASWYGGKFQGRQTANGEIFDTYKLTAAHKTLPFGTIVKVTNLHNNKSVEVRINDRGPFVEGRIIDLSKAAADAIDMTTRGVATVRLEIISSPGGNDDGKAEISAAQSQAEADSGFIVQIASFSKLDNAENTLKKLYGYGFNPAIELSSSGMYRVIINTETRVQADTICRKLANFGYTSPLIRDN